MDKRNVITHPKGDTNRKMDDTHWSYYENNPDYIDVNLPIEKFLEFLKKNMKKHSKTRKNI